MPYTHSHDSRKPRRSPVRREPVVTATILVPGIVALAAWLGFDVDEETALAVAGVVAAIGGLIARHFVTPTASRPIRKRSPREG